MSQRLLELGLDKIAALLGPRRLELGVFSREKACVVIPDV